MERKYVTVSALNRYLKHKFDTDRNLQQIFIKGEISNYRAHSSGHLYFTLKDENSRVNVVMFASKAKLLPFQVENGMKVLIEGSVSVYEATGNYQIYVNKMELDGIGNLFLQFEKRKQELAREGLFDQKHKKQIPAFATKIAVLSAYPSAALMDIMRTIKMRFPIAQVIIFPIPVQGKDAYLKIIPVLKQVDKLHFDVMILARGGGSLEDLWNFNEEPLIREIFACQTPIISGVGHEIDTTLCDYVSDYRAATPTAAAIKATPDLLELKKRVIDLRSQLEYDIRQILQYHHHNMNKMRNFYLFINPNKLYEEKQLRLDMLQEQLRNQLLHKKNNTKNHYDILLQRFQHQSHLYVLKQKYQVESCVKDMISLINTRKQLSQERFYNQLSKLNTLSPLQTLQRGYAMVIKDDTVIQSVDQLESGDKITIHLKDGDKKATVE